MTHPYPSIDENGIVEEVQAEFVRALRKPLAGPALFAGKETRVGHWGIESLKWREVSELSDVVVSMDIPPIQADSGTMTSKSVEIPIFTKDLHFSGRAWRQAQESGLDPVAVQEAGEAMATEINEVLLRGFGAGKPGPDTGLLNDPGASVSATTVSSAETFNDAIAAAVKVLNTALHFGPYTLVVPVGEMDHLSQFISGTNVRIGSDLAYFGIKRVLADHTGPANTLYLIDDTGVGNFDFVTPRNEDGMSFGLGDAAASMVSSMQEDHPMMKSRTIRLMNMGAPRIIRPTAVCVITIS